MDDQAGLTVLEVDACVVHHFEGRAGPELA
jgi:hypothetical protein